MEPKLTLKKSEQIEELSQLTEARIMTGYADMLGAYQRAEKQLNRFRAEIARRNK